MTDSQPLGASFRDPGGFLFTRQGVLYRQVNRASAEDYDLLMQSGLYGGLVKAGLLIPHDEIDLLPADAQRAYKVLRPEPVRFISYPYEWSFSQLKDAALTTLKVQRRALAQGMVLKDASTYNLQFHAGRPVLIDTLSFTRYQEGTPWVAYRQFCQHFLAPLALMALRDIRLGGLLRQHLDGIPLDLASRLLPSRSRLNIGLLLHLHLHAAAQRRYAGQAVERSSPQRQMSRNALTGLLDGLESAVRRLTWQPAGTDWGDYYEASAGHYSAAALEHKRQTVADYLGRARPESVWDLGANTGLFSRLASTQGIPTVAFDVDPAAVERNYLDCLEEGETHLLPLLSDLTNPSPAIGWANQERQSLLQRGPAEAVMALALVHHLAIANNVPLPRLADFFKALGRWLIVEFVPKEDSQVQRLLASREDIFEDYDQGHFERAFELHFHLRDQTPLKDTSRVLYLMESR